MKVLIVTVLLLLNSASLAVETTYLQSLRDTDYQYVESKVLDRGLHVFVKVPEDFDPTASYPTIYLLDGGSLFPLLASYHGRLVFAEEAPKAIIVGLSYGAATFAEGNYRSTDFTAPSSERDYWGGASVFQTFLADELIPKIESMYPSDPSRRIIFGQSLAGQFVLFSAQTRPGLFWGHIASNPALHRNLDFFLETVPTTATASHVFVASGTNDDPRFRVPALKWMDHWTAMRERPWALTTIDLEGESHMSAPPAAYRQGLMHLFSRN